MPSANGRTFFFHSLSKPEKKVRPLDEYITICIKFS